MEDFQNSKKHIKICESNKFNFQPFIKDLSKNLCEQPTEILSSNKDKEEKRIEKEAKEWEELLEDYHDEELSDWVRCSPADLYFKRNNMVIFFFISSLIY